MYLRRYRGSIHRLNAPKTKTQPNGCSGFFLGADLQANLQSAPTKNPSATRFIGL
jgi:hypothetical protein